MDQFGLSNLLHGVPWSLLYVIRLRWGRCGGLYAYTISSLSGGTLTIGSHAGIGEGNIIVCHDSIQIGEGTILAPHVFIYDHDHKYDHGLGVSTKEYRTSPVIIGKNCWIGANTIILRGTIIGDNCVIGAGSVIKGEFPSGVTVVQKRTTEMINLNERYIAISKGSD